VHSPRQRNQGAAAGSLFLLEPWQKAIVANLFGWKRPDGTRRYREAFVYVGEENGKNRDDGRPILLLVSGQRSGNTGGPNRYERGGAVER